MKSRFRLTNYRMTRGRPLRLTGKSLLALAHSRATSGSHLGRASTMTRGGSLSGHCDTIRLIVLSV